MKTFLKRSGWVALAGLMTVSPFAFATPTDDMGIGAEILAPLVLETQEDMNFGGIIPDAAGDTVTLSPAGVATAAAGSTFPNGDQQQGIFTLIGGNASAVTVTHDATVTLIRVGGSSTMAVSNFAYAATVGDLGAAAPGSVPVTLDATGNATIAMGADLAVGANQTAGVYTGTLALTAAYD